MRWGRGPATSIPNDTALVLSRIFDDRECEAGATYEIHRLGIEIDSLIDSKSPGMNTRIQVSS
jgi:hypothetical protein